ncbi:MAG: DUF4365 domain-containing protein [Rhodobacter sp.]|nr:DUF4365 domain-containing protein [Rhodobacter sp.]
MITIQHTQESLNRAFISAVAGCAGVNWCANREFDYGLDGTFRPVAIRGSRRVETGFPLDFQLKCTKNWNFEDEFVAYSLETKTFNDFVRRDPEGIGAVLILLCIPAEQNQWAVFSEESMILRNCCYFFKPEGEPVENEHSRKKILIPRANVLNVNSLTALLQAERDRKLYGGEVD